MTIHRKPLPPQLPFYNFGLTGSDLTYKRTASEKLRDEGIQCVTSKNGRWLHLMRLRARSVAISKGSVTADDLRSYADLLPLKPTHRNAWGGIFRGDEWKPVGYVNSTKLANHARKLVEWRLA